MSNLSTLAESEIKKAGINFNNGSLLLILLLSMTPLMMLIKRAPWLGALKATPSLVGQSLALCCGFMQNVHISFNRRVIIAAHHFVVS